MSLFVKKIRHLYGDMKLHTKIILAMILIVTLPFLLIGILFYGNLRDMVISDTIRKEQDTSAKTAPIIEEMIQDVLDSYQEITQLPFMEQLFHMPVNSIQELTSSASARSFSAEIESIMEKAPLSGFQIYLDLPENNSLLHQECCVSSFFSSLMRAKGTYWYGIFQGSNVKELYCPSFYLGIKEQAQYGDMAYIRPTTVYYQGESYPAYIAVYYSTKPIQDILVRNLSLSGSVSYIINERDSLVSSSDTSLSGIYWLDYQTIEESFMSSNNYIERTILDTTVYAGFYNILQPGWFMVTVLPLPPLIERSNHILIEFLLFCLLFLLLAYLVANVLSRSITNRISSVISQMHLVREGIPVPMESPEYHDEIGDLIDTYNFMSRRMDQLMLEQQQSAEDLRIAEFNSLQAQINPHFLYNTMDMINWLAQQGRTDEVSSAIQKLSRFYKLTLSRKQSISTIAQEEEHISIYIHLQNMRFHDNITFISDIPDELMDYQIPKLTLQPVIENAILHGILEKENKSGTIVLTGWTENKNLVLMISDDGVGIPPERLKTILTGAGKSSSQGTNIAIYNTHRRLQILYGKDYGMTYHSIPGEGTEVEIRLPARNTLENSEINPAL